MKAYLRVLAFVLCGCAALPRASAQSPGADTVFLASGEKSTGKLIGIDAQNVRLQKPLAPPPGSPASAAPMFATVAIPLGMIERVEFAGDDARDARLARATPDEVTDIGGLWLLAEPWLALPKSPAGRIGVVYGDLLLRSGTPDNAVRALEVFTRIEEGSWSDDDVAQARQGRLRAMVATGRAGEAVAEATELAKVSEDPAVLVEAKYILAEAADRGLRKLIEDNPRWEQDVFVIPERHRLYHEALDLYLFPYLFFGSEAEPAARGLWGAARVYQFTGETAQAVECARDIAAIYPGTKYAIPARQFLDSLPQEARQQDLEKEAREEAALEKPKTTHEK